MPFLSHISAAFSFLPLIMVVFLWKKRPLPDDIFWVCNFVIATALLEGYLKITGLLHIPNHDVSNFFIFLEYPLIIMILRAWITSETAKKIIVSSIPLYYGVCLFLYFNGSISFYTTKPSPLLLSTTFAFMAISGFFSLVYLKQDRIGFAHRDYKTWILIAIILFYANTACIYFVVSTTDLSWLRKLFFYNLAANIAHNILITIGLWLFSKTRSSDGTFV